MRGGDSFFGFGAVLCLQQCFILLGMLMARNCTSAMLEGEGKFYHIGGRTSD